MRRSTSAAVPFLCPYGNGERGCVCHSRGFYETMESWWRSTRDWAVNPRPNRFDEIEFRAGKHLPLAVFTHQRKSVVSSLIRRFRWPRAAHRYEVTLRDTLQPSLPTCAIESRREIWRCTREFASVGNTISINVHGLYTGKTKDRSIFDNSISHGATWSGRYRVRTRKRTPYNTGN